ncbi:EscU/YscU/HrcU family type III secretion system export apparatus switch protein [Frigidibacter sp. MR17.24]|uniref:EscU/YscU/HrcU family type III secretion system export apparatus switch protein n=1 Tax=Frigidibacter sp. MR17.24 TaxID=3127345 RepID=UPI0030129EE9
MSEDAERNLPPTEKRLADARARGDTLRAPDFSAALALLGTALAMALGGAEIARRAGTALMGLLAMPGIVGPDPLHLGGAGIAGAVLAALGAVLPVLLATLALGLIAAIVTGGLTFAPPRIAPKLSRISPLANAGHKFGLSGIVEFLKSLVKMAVTGALAWWVISRDLERIIAATATGPGQVVALLAVTLRDLLIYAAILALAIGVADLGWQVFDRRRKLSMTRQEVMDEMKENEGDPHVKARRQARGREIATNRMLADVPKADVVIVNPEHYAVALRWRRGTGRAPECVAKGVDEIATRIRARAAEAGVPIHRDPPTARALYATVEIGRQITPDQYRAVAAAIRFAEAMRRKARQRGGIAR